MTSTSGTPTDGPPDQIVDGHGPDDAHAPGPELRRLADALRLVVDQITRTEAAPGTLIRAAETVEAAAAVLEPETPSWGPHIPARGAPDGDPHDYFPFSPVVGFFNPLAPPVEVEVRDGVVHGQANLGSAFEGPPGCVHGGVIASMFDELLGIVNIAAGVGAMTGTLTIRYRKPTPLQTDLRFELRHTGVERRKVFAAGSMYAGDELCAEAEGIFILTAYRQFDDLRVEAEARATGR
ncbi:MAG: PaaI family thioesterase [Acidimicrobiia bacterium]